MRGFALLLSGLGAGLSASLSTAPAGIGEETRNIDGVSACIAGIENVERLMRRTTLDERAAAHVETLFAAAVRDCKHDRTQAALEKAELLRVMLVRANGEGAE